MLKKFIGVCLLSWFMVSTSWAGTITGTVTLFGKGKKNAAVHLVGVKGAFTVPTEHAVIVQKGQKYIPRVLPVVIGTTVDFPNKDTVFHNAFSLTPGNDFDFGTYGPGGNPGSVFNVPGTTDIFCNMHEQMHGLVIVLEHPYFALTSKKGAFEINDVPEGTYTIKAWTDPSSSAEKTIVVSAAGTVKIDIAVKK